MQRIINCNAIRSFSKINKKSLAKREHLIFVILIGTNLGTIVAGFSTVNPIPESI